VTPGWCPFSVVRDFYAIGRVPRKGFPAVIQKFSPIHRMSTTHSQLSTAGPGFSHRKSTDARRQPAGPAHRLAGAGRSGHRRLVRSGSWRDRAAAFLVRAGNRSSQEFPLAPGSAARTPNSVNRSQKASWKSKGEPFAAGTG